MAILQRYYNILYPTDRKVNEDAGESSNIQKWEEKNAQRQEPQERQEPEKTVLNSRRHMDAAVKHDHRGSIVQKQGCSILCYYFRCFVEPGILGKIPWKWWECTGAVKVERVLEFMWSKQDQDTMGDYMTQAEGVVYIFQIKRVVGKVRCFPSNKEKEIRHLHNR